MTDRHTAYLVTLAEPIREDDAEPTAAALGQIKGVIDVRPFVAGMEQMGGAIRMDQMWRAALEKLLHTGPET
jgi:hypothetical protein